MLGCQPSCVTSLLLKARLLCAVASTYIACCVGRECTICSQHILCFRLQKQTFYLSLPIAADLYLNIYRLEKSTTNSRMSTCSEPHLACHHTGYEFDWWRCKEGGYVGRPPSPFPASFETYRYQFRPDSSDPRNETGVVADHDVTDACTGVIVNGTATNGVSPQNNHGWQYDGGANDAHRLYWPLCQRSEDVEPFQTEDVGNVMASTYDGNRKKTPRLPYKRPPWIPTKMPNKWGVAGHPPPYTNYCKETLFNTRTADPTKVTIRTTF